MLKDAQAGATLAVTDIDRARAFYAETLGFPVAQESEGGILFQAGQGSAFFVYPSSFAGTNEATAMTLNVADFEPRSPTSGARASSSSSTTSRG